MHENHVNYINKVMLDKFPAFRFPVTQVLWIQLLHCINNLPCKWNTGTTTMQKKNSRKMRLSGHFRTRKKFPWFSGISRQVVGLLVMVFTQLNKLVSRVELASAWIPVHCYLTTPPKPSKLLAYNRWQRLTANKSRY